MKKNSITALFCVSFFFIFVTTSHAIFDPLSVPNNKYGIHILFDNELEDAGKLVNGNGGEWGYVLIPVQAGDKDLAKWQKFMDDAKKLKLTPVIRLATEGDYFNTKIWRKPKEEDILDFANFLNSLDWPVKNRYIIVFNEANRADEWGGQVEPQEYAALLSYAVTVFKSKSDDFFMISAGLDNGAPNATGYMNQYDYMRQMHARVPGIFNQIDGLASHSYPNPGFSQPPSQSSTKSISSFQHEQDLAQKLSNKKLPVFITETGWTSNTVSDETRAQYYKEAFDTVWSDESIVAVMPFLLKAGSGPFKQFTFLQEDGSPTMQHNMVRSMPKTKGEPHIVQKVLGSEAHPANDSAPVVYFAQNYTAPKKKVSLSSALRGAFSWIMKLE